MMMVSAHEKCYGTDIFVRPQGTDHSVDAVLDLLAPLLIALVDCQDLKAGPDSAQVNDFFTRHIVDAHLHQNLGTVGRMCMCFVGA